MLNRVRALKKESTGLKTAGFTIIEVMIVLAIAGLIMAIVFVAIPQLQRNTRNTTRRDVIGRVKTELDNYAGNNSGKYPTADANTTTGFSTGGGFPTRYLSNVSYNDPSTGSSMTLNGMTAAAITAGTYAGTQGQIDYALGVVCNGEAATTTGAVARNYVIMSKLEGGAIYCADNH